MRNGCQEQGLNPGLDLELDIVKAYLETYEWVIF